MKSYTFAQKLFDEQSSGKIMNRLEPRIEFALLPKLNCCLCLSYKIFGESDQE